MSQLVGCVNFGCLWYGVFCLLRMFRGTRLGCKTIGFRFLSCYHCKKDLVVSFSMEMEPGGGPLALK